MQRQTTEFEAQHLIAVGSSSGEPGKPRSNPLSDQADGPNTKPPSKGDPSERKEDSPTDTRRPEPGREL